MQYLRIQIEKASIDVRYHIKATPSVVEELNPDAIIIAIGAQPVMPNIKGIEKPIVKEAVSSYEQIEEIGKKVVIIGGGTVGCEMALKLAEEGHLVSIIEATDTLNAQGHMLYRIGIRHAMDKVKENITCFMSSLCVEIQDHGVVIEKEREQIMIEADTVLIAVGQVSKKEEAYRFYNITPATYTVGDCDRVAKVLEATNEAYFIAANL